MKFSTSLSIVLASSALTLSSAAATPKRIKPTPGHAILYRNATTIGGLDPICTHKVAEGQNVRYDDSGYEPCTNVDFYQPANDRGYFDVAHAMRITELAPNECGVFLYSDINCMGTLTQLDEKNGGEVGKCISIPDTKSLMVVCD